MRLSVMIGAALFAGFGTSCAFAADEDQWCRNGLFPASEAGAPGLAKVNASSRAYLIDDKPGCPSAAPACRQRAYLVRGDVVITGRRRGAFQCVYYPSSDSAGWLRSNDLERIPTDSAPPLRAWSGDWRADDDEIRLTVQGGALRGHGLAFWPRRRPPAGWSSLPGGGPNDGEFEGAARPNGATVAFRDGDCQVQLRLVGPLLMADDNGQCGGLNVSFNGVYRRK